MSYPYYRIPFMSATGAENVSQNTGATHQQPAHQGNASSEQQQHQSMMIVSRAEAMNPHWRSTMEDRCVIHPAGTWGAPDKDMAYFGVYDGHGGRDIVDFLEHGLSHHVAEELLFDDDSNVETRLVRAFLMTDLHSLQAGIKSSGATVAICLVKRHAKNPHLYDLVTANVGDARVVLGYEGKAVRLSKDHRSDDPLEVARIEQAGGFLFRGRVLGVLAVTRSLGDHVLKKYVIAHPNVGQKRVDVSASTRGEPSFLILACDGLFDVISDQEAVDLVKSFQGDKTDVAGLLVEEALQRGTTDNVTAVVVWLL